MRKTLTLTLATGLLVGGLAHACPPRVSTRQLIHTAHLRCARGERLEAELSARAARDYSAARRVLSERPPRLRRLVIEIKKTKIKK
jgi:hypothetical protein